MKQAVVLLVCLVASMLGPGYLVAQPESDTEEGNEISSTSFDGFELNSNLLGASISLQGDTDVSGDLSATGLVASSVGVMFPDGSTQTTAASTTTDGSLTANEGLYSNKVPQFTHNVPFTEICFKNGGVASDQHLSGESTNGGNCLPGDIGWVVEADERTADTWNSARADCLVIGMRLPEAFEFQFSCNSAGLFGLNNMDDDSEWISNRTLPLYINSTANGLVAPIAGNGSCEEGSLNWIVRTDSLAEAQSYRCLL